MAPPRKKKRAPGETHSVHLRLPSDVFEWVEAEAEKTKWPFNRVIINTLADYPDLLNYRDFAHNVGEMRNVLAAYGSRISVSEINEPLLAAIDEALAAPSDGELKRRLDRLRVLRAAMLKHEQESKKV